MSETTDTSQRILIAYDFSELAERGLQQGLRIASLSPHTELHVLCVGSGQDDRIRLPGATDAISQHGASEHLQKEIARVVEEYQRKGGATSVERIAVYVTEGHPSERIVSLAASLDADLIIMGTHSRTGLSRLVLGSVAEAVVRRAPCGVFVLRPRDFLNGEKVPPIDPPLEDGQPALRHFESTRRYHYVSRVVNSGTHTMPVE